MRSCVSTSPSIACSLPGQRSGKRSGEYEDLGDVSKGEMRERHHGLSVATPSRNPQVHPCSFISLSTVRVHVSLGLIRAEHV